MKSKSAKKNTVCCLLVHGFTGSPNELVDLGNYLKKNNVTIAIPTLPGHATHSADLFNYGWRDWFNAVKSAYSELAKSCQEVFVCGMSMGGTLGLHLAAHENLAGMIAMSAPVQFPHWQRAAIKVVKRIRKFRDKSRGEDVRDPSARAKLGSYRRYPYSAVDELFQLTEHVRHDLPEVACPVLVLHSLKDHTIPFANADIICQEIGAQDVTRVNLSESFHVITVDVEKDIVEKAVLDFITSHSTQAAQSTQPKSAKTPSRKKKTVRQNNQ